MRAPLSRGSPRPSCARRTASNRRCARRCRRGLRRSAPEHASTKALVGEIPEESLDDIEPRAAGRDEVHVEALVALEPGQHLGVLVRGVVLDDQMDIEIPGSLGVDLVEELDPLLGKRPINSIRASSRQQGSDPDLSADRQPSRAAAASRSSSSASS